MPEACGVSDGVSHERPLLSHPLARLRPRGCGYGVLWLVRAETGGSSETALLLLTLRWNEKSRGLRGVTGVRWRGLSQPCPSIHWLAPRFLLFIEVSSDCKVV